ncbi:MAG TPA: hypothetical protein VGL56_07940 [Fimbriimonadaceae bacterium]
MKRKKFSVFNVLLGLLIVLGGLFFLFPACACGTGAKSVACMSNLKDIQLATLTYANDYDDQFPNKVWAVGIAPYLHGGRKTLKDFEPEGIQFGYAMHKAIAGRDQTEVVNEKTEIAYFDSTLDKASAISGLETLPVKGRHNGSNNAVYVDGHAKRIPAASPQRD